MVKSHGTSKAETIVAGIKLCEEACEANIKQEIEERLAMEDVKSLVFD